MALNPGDECSGGNFAIGIHEDGAAVPDGNSSAASPCMGNGVMEAGSINPNRFRATRNGSTWPVQSLP